MVKDMIETIRDLVVSYKNSIDCSCVDEIGAALHTLLNGNYIRYDFDVKNNSELFSKKDYQKILSNINERTELRKQKGVFYTPEDVANYIIWNSIVMYIERDNKKLYKAESALKYILNKDNEKIKKIIYNTTFMDPTCGAGEFLLCVVRTKLSILKNSKLTYSDNDIIKICECIYGNDLDECSTDISKIRVFIELSKELKNKNSYNVIANIINKHFYNIDFVVKNELLSCQYDFVVGNPPYIEYSKYADKESLYKGYGNIYADVINNTFSILKDSGVVGYIIPISYISTKRMGRIRKFVSENSDREFIMSFADRPDCLFPGVHQKLNILIARKGSGEHLLFTSNYKYWYKNERVELLNGCEIIENKYDNALFVPKIGNKIEEGIFRKISTSTVDNIYDRQDVSGKSLFVNMRACFWIKAFSFNPGSKEYKEFKYSEDEYSYILCLLNSSLFWIYWNMISDCWHITTKELNMFFVHPIDSKQCEIFAKLARDLELELERTKKYIGTKQTDYEYKHKDCKWIIDKMDDVIAAIYGLTDAELLYVKTYALKYRLGSGSNDGSN